MSCPLWILSLVSRRCDTSSRNERPGGETLALVPIGTRQRISPADVDKSVLCHRPNSHCVGRHGLATRIGRGIDAYGWR